MNFEIYIVIVILNVTLYVNSLMFPPLLKSLLLLNPNTFKLYFKNTAYSSWPSENCFLIIWEISFIF